MEVSFPSLLRWLLLVIGALVIGGVYLVSRRNVGKQSPSAQRIPPVAPGENAAHAEAPPTEEFIAGDVPFIPPVMSDEDTAHAEAAPAEGEPARATMRATMSERAVGGRLVVLHVQAKSGHKFMGDDILRIAERAGLERAASEEGGFFQRRASTGLGTPIEGEPLFYLANMFKPGVFKWTEMASFSTTGLSLFAQLPGALTPPEVFDELLECARLFADNLQGAVLDDSRSDLTAQTIQHIREGLQAYAMRETGRTAPGERK